MFLHLAIFASFKTATHFVSNDFHIDLGDEADNKYGTSEYEESFDSTLNYATLNFDGWWWYPSRLQTQQIIYFMLQQKESKIIIP